MLDEILNEPLAIEAIVAALLVLLLYLAFRALKGVAERISRRRALEEFVNGVDLFFKGEYAEARAALAKVIERDPENSEARILLGDACREMGDLAEAHKHHYQVLKVFGQDLERNHLSLGRDLMRMGKAEEAIPHLARALEGESGNGDAADLLLTANLESGRYQEAVTLAKRQAEKASGEESARAERKQASVCAVAGRRLLERGETKEGLHLLRSAVKLNPALVTPRLDLVRSAYLTGPAKSAEKELVQQLKEMTRLAEKRGLIFEPPSGDLAAGAGRGSADRAALAAPAAPVDDAAPAARSLPGPERTALPAPAAVDGGEGRALAPRGEAAPEKTPKPVAPAIPEEGLRADPGEYVRSLLPREAAYVCVRCGRPEIAFTEMCPECGGYGTLMGADLTPLVEVRGMREVFDEILENRAFVRTLVRRVARGDDAAADKLVEIGRQAVPGIFREVLSVEDHSALVAVLARMGRSAVPAILKSFRKARAFSTKRLVREGMKSSRPLDGLVVRAFVGMGTGVVNELAPLLEAGEKDLRNIALDVLIRLGDADRLEDLRLTVSSKEMLERLGSCPPEELGPLLDACPEGGYLTTRVLVDRTFSAEEALVAALGRKGNRGKMRLVLMERGFSSQAYEALEALWEDRSARAVVSDVIRSYGRVATDHLIQTYTTSTLPESVREEALRLILDLGGDEIERLTERLSEGDPEVEKAVLRVIRAFGSRAVPALSRAYGKTGLLAKVGLNRRRVQLRKMTLLRAIAQLGSYDALQALRQLRLKEGDADLRRRIDSIIERLSAGGEER